MTYILLADNLNSGAARLAESIIYHWPKNSRLIVFHSNNLMVLRKPCKGIKFQLHNRAGFLVDHLARIRLIQNHSDAIVINLTNFPIPRKFFGVFFKLDFTELLIFHNLFLMQSPQYWFKKPDLRFVLSSCAKRLYFRILMLFEDFDCLITQTKYVSDLFNKSFKQVRSRPQYITNLILNNNVFLTKDCILNDLSFEATENWFYPSAYYPHKNHDLLIDLARAILYRGLKIKIFVTLDPKYANKFLSILVNHKLDTIIVNLGWISHSETQMVLRMSKGLLFLSTFETLGLPLLEAISQRKPIVAAEIEVTKEVLSQNSKLVKLDCNNCVDQILEHICSVGKWHTQELDLKKYCGKNEFLEYVYNPILKIRAFRN